MRARLALLLCVVVFVAGCGSTSIKPEVYCFKTVDSAARLIDIGMSAAGDAYRDELISDAARDKLIAAHDVYRPVAKTVLTGCKVVGTRGDADKLIESLQEAADRIIKALVAVGVAP